MQFTGPYSVTLVQAVLRIYRDQNDDRVTTQTDDLYIITIRKRSRKKTAPEKRAQMNEIREEILLVSTVQRRLRHAGLFGRVAVREPILRPQKQDQTVKMGQKPS